MTPEQLQHEQQKLEEQRQELEQKNKQMWSISETVYREKKKIEEQLKGILGEKEALEIQKKENEEKVKMLWEQSTAIHHEKERINTLKVEVEIKHKEIIDSVTYAKRIQEAILPDKNEISSCLPNSFVLFKPRDIVSGDFYWFYNRNNQNFIAAIDCTGHGVPGAFMSMIGNTILNQVVKEKGISDPGMILQLLNDEINHSLKQNQQDSESRDGMDAAICCFDFTKSEMRYAGAMRPLYIVKGGVLEEYKADKFSVGGRNFEIPKKFETKVFAFDKNDVFYISSDGYADQFGAKDKKLMTRKFKDLLVSIHHLEMSEQRDFLDKFLEDWKGALEQTDDILVIGVKT
jgi:serine phosphatase RsbU (regulator of sigma subunit)